MRSLFFSTIGILFVSGCEWSLSSLPGSADAYRHLPSLFSSSVPPIQLALVTWYILFTGWVGRYWIRSSVPEPVRWLAGFLPGYLVVAGIHSVVFLFPISHHAEILVFLSLVIAVLIDLPRRLHWGASLAVAGVVCVAFVYQVSHSGAHVTGDAGIFFLNLLNDPALREAPPFFLQHHDEFSFLYPILYWGGGEGVNALFSLWCLQALGKASLLVNMVVIFERYSSLSFAIALSATLFIGNLFLIPWKTYLLFDSGFPLGNVLHIGRLAGVWLVLFSLAPKRLWSPYSFALGLGIASTTISNTFFIFQILGFSFLRWKKVRRRHIGLAVGLFLILAYRPVSWELNIVVLLLPLALAWGTGLSPRGWKRMLPLLLGIGGGLLFSGNMVSGKLLQGLFQPLSVSSPSEGAYSPFYEKSLGGRTVVERKGFSGEAQVLSFRSQSCRSPREHCQSNFDFLRLFGFPIVLFLWATFFSQKKGRILNLARGALIYYGVGFVLYDYAANGPSWLSIWVKSRFVEPWFYLLISTSALHLWNRSQYRILIWIVLLVALVGGVRSHRVGSQIGNNMDYLLKSLKASPLRFRNHDFEISSLEGWSGDCVARISGKRVNKEGRNLRKQGRHHLFVSGGPCEFFGPKFRLAAPGTVDFLLRGDGKHAVGLFCGEGVVSTHIRTQSSSFFEKEIWRVEKFIGDVCRIRIHLSNERATIDIDDINAPTQGGDL